MSVGDIIIKHFFFSREELLNRWQSSTKMKSELLEKSLVYQQTLFKDIHSLVGFLKITLICLFVNFFIYWVINR